MIQATVGRNKTVSDLLYCYVNLRLLKNWNEKNAEKEEEAGNEMAARTNAIDPNDTMEDFLAEALVCDDDEGEGEEDDGEDDDATMVVI